jgi:predicted nuclease with TOPRIM domain
MKLIRRWGESVMNNYEELKKQYEELVESNARAKAKAEVLMEQLKELGCDTLEEAEEKVKELQAKVESTQSKIDVIVADVRGALDAVK